LAGNQLQRAIQFFSKGVIFIILLQLLFDKYLGSAAMAEVHQLAVGINTLGQNGSLLGVVPAKLTLS